MAIPSRFRNIFLNRKHSWNIFLIIVLSSSLETVSTSKKSDLTTEWILQQRHTYHQGPIRRHISQRSDSKMIEREDNTARMLTTRRDSPKSNLTSSLPSIKKELKRDSDSDNLKNAHKEFDKTTESSTKAPENTDLHNQDENSQYEAIKTKPALNLTYRTIPEGGHEPSLDIISGPSLQYTYKMKPGKKGSRTGVEPVYNKNSKQKRRKLMMREMLGKRKIEKEIDSSLQEPEAQSHIEINNALYGWRPSKIEQKEEKVGQIPISLPIYTKETNPIVICGDPNNCPPPIRGLPYPPTPIFTAPISTTKVSTISPTRKYSFRLKRPSKTKDGEDLETLIDVKTTTPAKEGEKKTQRIFNYRLNTFRKAQKISNHTQEKPSNLDKQLEGNPVRKYTYRTRPKFRARKTTTPSTITAMDADDLEGMTLEELQEFMLKNAIGKSKPAELKKMTEGPNLNLKVSTEKPETLKPNFTHINSSNEESLSVLSSPEDTVIRPKPEFTWPTQELKGSDTLTNKPPKVESASLPVDDVTFRQFTALPTTKTTTTLSTTVKTSKTTFVTPATTTFPTTNVQEMPKTSSTTPWFMITPSRIPVLTANQKVFKNDSSKMQQINDNTKTTSKLKLSKKKKFRPRMNLNMFGIDIPQIGSIPGINSDEDKLVLNDGISLMLDGMSDFGLKKANKKNNSIIFRNTTPLSFQTNEEPNVLNSDDFNYFTTKASIFNRFNEKEKRQEEFIQSTLNFDSGKTQNSTPFSVKANNTFESFLNDERTDIPSELTTRFNLELTEAPIETTTHFNDIVDKLNLAPVTFVPTLDVNNISKKPFNMLRTHPREKSNPNVADGHSLVGIKNSSGFMKTHVEHITDISSGQTRNTGLQSKKAVNEFRNTDNSNLESGDIFQMDESDVTFLQGTKVKNSKGSQIISTDLENVREEDRKVRRPFDNPFSNYFVKHPNHKYDKEDLKLTPITPQTTIASKKTTSITPKPTKEPEKNPSPFTIRFKDGFYATQKPTPSRTPTFRPHPSIKPFVYFGNEWSSEQPFTVRPRIQLKHTTQFVPPRLPIITNENRPELRNLPFNLKTYSTPGMLIKRKPIKFTLNDNFETETIRFKLGNDKSGPTKLFGEDQVYTSEEDYDKIPIVKKSIGEFNPSHSLQATLSPSKNTKKAYKYTRRPRPKSMFNFSPTSVSQYQVENPVLVTNEDFSLNFGPKNYETPFTVRPTTTPFTAKNPYTVVPENYIKYQRGIPKREDSSFDPSKLFQHDQKLSEPFDLRRLQIFGKHRNTMSTLSPYLKVDSKFEHSNIEERNDKNWRDDYSSDKEIKYSWNQQERGVQTLEEETKEIENYSKPGIDIGIFTSTINQKPLLKISETKTYKQVADVIARADFMDDESFYDFYSSNPDLVEKMYYDGAYQEHFDDFPKFETVSTDLTLGEIVEEEEEEGKIIYDAQIPKHEIIPKPENDEKSLDTQNYTSSPMKKSYPELKSDSILRINEELINKTIKQPNVKLLLNSDPAAKDIKTINEKSYNEEDKLENVDTLDLLVDNGRLEKKYDNHSNQSKDASPNEVVHYLKNPFGNNFIRITVDPKRFRTNKTEGIHHIPVFVNHPDIPSQKNILQTKSIPPEIREALLKQIHTHKEPKVKQPAPQRKLSQLKSVSLPSRRNVYRRRITGTSNQKNSLLQSIFGSGIQEKKIETSTGDENENQDENGNKVIDGIMEKILPPPVTLRVTKNIERLPHQTIFDNTSKKLSLKEKEDEILKIVIDDKRDQVDRESLLEKLDLGVVNDAMANLPTAIQNLPTFLQGLMSTVERTFQGRTFSEEGGRIKD